MLLFLCFLLLSWTSHATLGAGDYGQDHISSSTPSANVIQLTLVDALRTCCLVAPMTPEAFSEPRLTRLPNTTELLLERNPSNLRKTAVRLLVAAKHLHFQTYRSIRTPPNARLRSTGWRLERTEACIVLCFTGKLTTWGQHTRLVVLAPLFGLIS